MIRRVPRTGIENAIKIEIRKNFYLKTELPRDIIALNTRALIISLGIFGLTK